MVINKIRSKLILQCDENTKTIIIVVFETIWNTRKSIKRQKRDVDNRMARTLL